MDPPIRCTVRGALKWRTLGAVSAARVKMRVPFAHPPYLGVAVAEGSAIVAGGGATRVVRGQWRFATLYGGGA